MRAWSATVVCTGMIGLLALATQASYADVVSTCCIPDIGVGCDDPFIESCVCGFDPFCCSNSWDSLCVDEVEQCAPGFCPRFGACCLQDNSCQDSVEVVQCSASGGVYQGDDTQCQFLTCDPNHEACCLPGGDCVVLDPVDCNSNGGLPQGPGTDCSIVTCPTDEACCFPDTNCNDLPPGLCNKQGGQSQGPGTNCSSVFCPSPDEACCFPDGSCQDLEPLDCGFLGGIAQGFITTCGMTTCPPPPTEACCYPDGNCFDQTVDFCTNSGGEPQGPGTDCQTAVCPLPTVACCLPDETCQNLFSSVCFDLGGYLFPEGSSCADPGIDCTDCNGNAIPDNIEIAAGSANDINTNATPDDCEQDLNENGIPDEWEISQGSATDIDTNGIPDIVDILSCRYDDMNYNNLPDAIEIAEGSATDANTNGIIDDAEQPSNQRSAIALLRRLRGGTLLADSNGVPQKYWADSNGVIFVDSNGSPFPRANGRKFISYMRDIELAEKLGDILIDTSGPAPVSRVKDAKIFVQSCHGGGMLDEIDKVLGDTVCWVGGAASRGNEVAHCDSDRVADPMGHWVRPLMDAMSNGLPVLQAIKRASRESKSSPFINTTGTRDQGTYWRGRKPGAENITLEDPTAASHHAVFIAGITDQIGIENEITRFCELLEEQWGDLNTTGTSVHILFGAGRVNPCASNGVPDANVMSAEYRNVCSVLDGLVPDLGPNEEFVLFLGDHGLGTETPVNTSAFQPVGGRAAPVITQTFNVDSETIHGMTRNPDNQAFIRVRATGLYPPNLVEVSVNGRFLAYLSPLAEDEDGQNVHEVPLPDTAVRAGSNTLSIDLAGTGAIILETEFFTGAMARVPVPGWADMNGDLEVDLADMPDFTGCLNGPTGGYLVPTCYDADIDLDGDVDLVDAKLLQQVFTGGL
jgi:hypothetical protein